MTRTNNDRAATANTAISAMAVECNTCDEPQDQNICDLLVNLRHLCDAEGLSFEKLLRMSEMHYEAEAGEMPKADADYAEVQS